MRSMMHHDYWVEIPEGEFDSGLSEDQKEFIWRQLLEKSGYHERSLSERNLMDTAVEKLRQNKPLGYEESKVFGNIHPPSFSIPHRKVWIRRFYIARFPLLSTQYDLLKKGQSPDTIPGVQEVSETWMSRRGEPVYNRCAAFISDNSIFKLCEQYDLRIPTTDEWEKAARGTDGRLYPWGNEWDESRGFFYYGQKRDKTCAGGEVPVDAYPEGVSPYGLWNMAGDLPELVILAAGEYTNWHVEFHGETIGIGEKGQHPRGSSQEDAWSDHIVALKGYGDWVTARLAMDEWPQHYWSGHTSESE
jgi:formylglycine-generating enzyme required for sulfatase activity